MGISFHRHIGEERTAIHSSLAQLFSNRSEGLVLKGRKFQWEIRNTHGHPPARVVIHKTSTYWPDELTGFKEGLKSVGDYDLVTVTKRGVRLFREGEYPPLRGTHAQIAEKHAARRPVT